MWLLRSLMRLVPLLILAAILIAWVYLGDARSPVPLWRMAVPAAAAVDLPLGATALAAGQAHACALVGDGRAECWGYNAAGQLGDGRRRNRATPAPVWWLRNATAIAAGGGHTCALVRNGAVRCWGTYTTGRRGDNTTAWKARWPRAVAGLRGATALAVGRNHACAVVAGGAVQCWGYNAEGQLGDGTTAVRTAPAPVPGVTGATALAGGDEHTCALVTGGGAVCWGSNGFGQLGDGTPPRRSGPVAVAGLRGAVALAAGAYHTCALMGDGGVQCWGHNGAGQLGDGTTADRAAPVAVQGVRSAAALAAGGAVTCALVAGGTANKPIQCWGINDSGQLGDGTQANRARPVPVQSAGKVTALAVGSGGFTCAVVAGGAVRCWGDNSYGQLGVEPPVQPEFSSPRPTATPMPAQSFSAAATRGDHLPQPEAAATVGLPMRRTRPAGAP